MTTQQIERRAFNVSELRAATESRMITGHAAVFDQLSEELFGFREQIAPGAFEESVGQDDIRALWNHDANFVLGRNTSGTLSLHEDARGLAVRIDAPETQWADDLLVSIRRGDISQMSFGFITLQDEWAFDHEDDMVIRTLVKVRLFDVSPVTFPAYPRTDVTVAKRSLEAFKESLESERGEDRRRRESERSRHLALTEREV